MVEPKAGTATTTSGRTITVPVKDASEIVDYKDIKAKAYRVKEVARDALKAVSNKTKNIEAGGEALSIEDKKLKPLIDEVADFIGSLAKEGIYESLDAARDYAEVVHDQFQEEYNAAAQEEANRQAEEAG